MKTLKELEAAAEEEFEERADKWVHALAEREGVRYGALRPYLASLHYEPGYWLRMVFVIPGHTAIELISNAYPIGGAGRRRRVAEIVDGKLIGAYEWHAFRPHCSGSVSFHGVESLGYALLLARWAFEEDEKAKWI